MSFESLSIPSSLEFALDPAVLCRIFFCLGTTTIIGGGLIPSFRELIMNYGSRNTESSPLEVAKKPEEPASLVNQIASLQVPHAWFTHFYIVSTASSLFWGHQIVTRGQAFRFLASHSGFIMSDSMTANQVLLAWSMMSFQGVRRLYESITLTKPSKSKMWVGLWAIGIGYYFFMGISVWIEGIKTLDVETPLASHLELSRPSLKTATAVFFFLLASGIQNECHNHLASLKKYTLPENRFFQSVVCPHYTSECIIYTAIAVVAAPQHRMFNLTVLAGLSFVITNLGATADSTREWYVRKFGKAKLDGRWSMVPYVF